MKFVNNSPIAKAHGFSLLAKEYKKLFGVDIVSKLINKEHENQKNKAIRRILNE